MQPRQCRQQEHRVSGGLCPAPVPRRKAGTAQEQRCEGETDSVVSGYASLESLIPEICSHVLPGPIQVSEEPRACSSFSCADLGFYTVWVSVAKKLWLGFFWYKTPGFCAALAHALVSVSYILHQLFSLCLAGELHHVDKPVCVGAAPVIFAAVPRCSPQPSLSARISRCLEESCA